MVSIFPSINLDPSKHSRINKFKLYKENQSRIIWSSLIQINHYDSHQAYLFLSIFIMFLQLIVDHHKVLSVY